MTEIIGTGANLELGEKELSLTGPARIVTDFLTQSMASGNIKDRQTIKVSIYRHTFPYEIETTLREGVK